MCVHDIYIYINIYIYIYIYIKYLFPGRDLFARDMLYLLCLCICSLLVCVCVCVCLCVCIYIYAYIHKYIHIYIHIYAAHSKRGMASRTEAYTYMCVVQKYTHIFFHTYSHIHTQTHKQATTKADCKCPAGHQRDKRNATDIPDMDLPCIPCPAGYWADEGQGNCTSKSECDCVVYTVTCVCLHTYIHIYIYIRSMKTLNNIITAASETSWLPHVVYKNDKKFLNLIFLLIAEHSETQKHTVIILL